MKFHHFTVTSLTTIAIASLLAPSVAIASEEDRAIQLCESKISDVYDINKFRNVWTDRLGNHKFRVHGKAKINNHKYDFNCKIKNGHVKSFAYDGPHGRSDDGESKDSKGSNANTALAIGAGLAIVAAIAASSKSGSKSGSSSDRLSVNKSVLEDECHDNLQYRIRDEHDYTARVNMKNSRVEGHNLVGDAKVRYDREDPHHASFTCHFDSKGRVIDSNYHLY